MNTNDNRLKAHKLIDHIFQDLLPAHGMAQRPEQIQLSHRMLDAMQDGRIALCDAGTGIGKTYAYLAAATAASAFPTGQIARPIIISTSSIALQNAVLTEYLPLLSCVLMADGILTKPLKAVIRKGKSHYVCDERLDRRLRQVYASNISRITSCNSLSPHVGIPRGRFFPFFFGIYSRLAGFHWYFSSLRSSIILSIFWIDIPSTVSSVTPLVIAPLFGYNFA